MKIMDLGTGMIGEVDHLHANRPGEEEMALGTSGGRRGACMVAALKLKRHGSYNGLAQDLPLGRRGLR